ncbi:hypothetical protein DL93DRAFT_2164354 [Clavulina sp. PMI_390]|nr:hypothetical protein DL93DRAFT_2164354 [Clavulina sp. PMI_390]
MSDPAASPATSLFKKSANKKSRASRRERSPNHDSDQAQNEGDTSMVGPMSMDMSFDQSNSRPSTPSNGADTSPMAQAAKIKAKHKSRAKMQSQLSFGGDDSDATGDEFKVKKSALSRKLALSSSSSPAKTQLSEASFSTPQSSGGMYSKSYLAELKANTPSTPAFKAQPSSNPISLAAGDDGNMSMEYDAMEESFTADTLPDIPTEASIKAAKEKRERMRHLGITTSDSPSDEFISLSLTKTDKRDQGPHPESRLQTEDDDLGEGDDDMAQYTEAQDRIALGKKARKNAAKQRKATIAELIDEAEDDEEDEEMKDWENAQLRRGGLVSDEGVTQEDLTYKPKPIPNPTALPSLPTALSRLSGTLSNMQTTHQMHQSNLEAVRAEANEQEAKEKEMRELVGNAEAKRAWMSDLYEWMETLATFLDTKFPTLEKYEAEQLSLLTERLDMLNKRREEDDEDDVSLFLYVPAPKPQPDAEEDEFGRDPIPQGPHAPAREARRASRTARLNPTPTSIGNVSLKKLVAYPDDEQGYATDGTLLTSDLEDFILAKQTLAKRVSSLLEDVRSPEFKDPNTTTGFGLAKRFAEWRQKYPESYTGAWGGLSMVGAWEFWARLEMVGWNPLEDSRTLDSFRWYAALYEYSRPPSASAMDVDSPDQLQEHERELGSDGDLVASMVTTSVIPLLNKFFTKGGVDPYSSKHVKRAVDLAEQVEICVEKSDAKFQTFARSFLAPFARAIETTHSLIAPALDPKNPAPPPPFDPAAIPARRRFLFRRVKLLVNLLAWRKVMGGPASRAPMDELIRRLLLDVMLPAANGGWEVGGKEIIGKAKSLLPRDLLSQDWVNALE